MHFRKTATAITLGTPFVIAALACVAGYSVGAQRYFYSHLLERELSPAMGSVGVILWLFIAVLLSLYIQDPLKLAVACFLLRLSVSAVAQVVYYTLSEGIVEVGARTFVNYAEAIDLMFYYDRYLSMQIGWLLEPWFLGPRLSNSDRSIRKGLVASLLVNIAYALISYAISRTTRNAKPVK